MTTSMTNIFDDLVNWLKTLVRIFWQSLSSADFYFDVYRHYSGYGIKYLINICLICSFLISFTALKNARDMEVFLTSENKNPGKMSNLHSIIEQFPEIIFDGKEITINSDGPYFIFNENGEKLVAIDTENKLNPREIDAIPIVFLKQRISSSAFSPVLTLFSVEEDDQGRVLIPYAQIWGKDYVVIDSKYLKDSLITGLRSLQNKFYFFFPVIAMMVFWGALFQNMFTFIIMSFATLAGGSPLLRLKSNMRLVSFSASSLLLIQIVTVLFLPMLANKVWLVQAWITIIMMVGFIKANFVHRW